MRIIALANQKGGVGKTTSTVNLAAILAARGKKVILIDLDPQAHLTTFLGIIPEQGMLSSYEVLTRSEPMANALMDVRENIKLLCSGLDLAAAEQELVSVVGRETILRDAIANYDQPVDYIFIDCPPSLGMLTLNALGAARELFIPLQPQFLSLQGLSQLLESILLVHKRINPELMVTGLFFCMFDQRLSLSSEIVGDIEEFFAQQRDADCPWKNITLFKTRIRCNVKLAESPSYGQTIIEYEKNCNGAFDYNALADEIMMMVGEMPPKTELPSEIAPEKSAEQPVDSPVVEAADASKEAVDLEIQAPQLIRRPVEVVINDSVKPSVESTDNI
ncbi:MAG: ParA family protein [Phycisphaerae bacterium]|nr:ParA family protein [Phycisphaerae bacterium]